MGLVGLAAGYWPHSLLDERLMSLPDAILVIPPLVLALALAFILGSGMVYSIFAISVIFSPQFARAVRSKI
ncbi:MAG: hypothetical protein M1318_04335 [Firmicutes bacterium]|nr:hypothetical protein [Bacillota bacterium]